MEGLTILEYFMAILTGHVPQSQLFFVPFEEDEKLPAKPRTRMVLRDCPQTNTTVMTGENTEKDKTDGDEDDSSESSNDVEKTPETRQKTIKKIRHHKAKLILHLDHTSQQKCNTI